jgi:hypothetical protein
VGAACARTRSIIGVLETSAEVEHSLTAATATAAAAASQRKGGRVGGWVVSDACKSIGLEYARR